MMTFNQCLLEHYNNGDISEEKALELSDNPQALRMNFKGIFLPILAESSSSLVSLFCYPVTAFWSSSRRETERRRRRLQWILQNDGMRRRFRHRVQPGRWLAIALLAVVIFFAFLGVAYEFFF